MSQGSRQKFACIFQVIVNAVFFWYVWMLGGVWASTFVSHTLRVLSHCEGCSESGTKKRGLSET